MIEAEEQELELIDLDETANWSKLELAEELAKQNAAASAVSGRQMEASRELTYFAEEEEPAAEESEYLTEDAAEETEYRESFREEPVGEEPEYTEAFGEEEEFYEEGDVEYLSMDEEAPEEDKQEKRKKKKKGKREPGFIAKAGAFFAGLSTMDKIVSATGVLVLAVAILTVSIYSAAGTARDQVAELAPLGEQLETVGVIGEDKLLAIADARKAQMAVGEAPEEYEEEDLSKEVKVEMRLTSVQKDLKIKFVNAKTDRLVGNVPFEVEITDSKGKTYVQVDEDKDGIIYMTKLTPGQYKVAMLELSDMEDYSFSTSPEKIKVKENIDYQKVDVSGEIKKESEVDLSKEDTAQKQETEAVLQDTVEWVESTQTAIGSKDGYTEVSKSTIADPSASARAVVGAGMFLRTAEVTAPPTTEGGEGTTPPEGGEGGENTNPPAETTISLNQSNMELTVGGSGSLTATVTPEGTAVEWSTSAGNVATVSNGTVTAVGAGEATITAAAGGKTATCKVTVKEAPPAKVPVESVAVTPAALSLEVGKTGALKAAVAPDTATDKSVTWKSSDEAVATIAADGTVTAVKAGTATMTATTTDGGKTATCTVTVGTAAVAVTEVKLDKTTLSLEAGKTAALKATVTPDNATNKTVSWTSSDKAIATVDEKGTVTGVKAGEATITATAGEKSAACKVTVTAATVTLSLKQTSATVYTGNTVSIQATAGSTVTWSVDNGNAAITDKGGKDGTYTVEVKGVKAGTAKVTAKAGDKTATCTITVKTNPKEDNSTPLKDKSGVQMYYYKDGKYYEAKAADYYRYDKFYKKGGETEYRYTGWQTLGDKTYFFDKNGNKVTGEQVIQGAKYNFASDGSLQVGSGNLGIDVSTHNGNINWGEVKKAGVSYAIIRTGFRGSTQGSLIEDAKFKANIQGATNAGIKVGVYFFTQAVNEVEAVEEASMVLNQVRNYKISYPIFIDVEASGGRADSLDSATRTKVINAFCQTIRNSGYTAGIYANKTWLGSKMNVSALSGYKIWLAQYNSTPTYKGRYDLWQYSDKGRIPGISTNVDMNLSYLGY